MSIDARWRLSWFLLLAITLVLIGSRANAVDAKSASAAKEFRAGAFAIDVSPLKFPVIINGGMRERTAEKVSDRLHARCLVLDDGTNKIAIAVVDNCMIPRDLLDEAKRLASEATGIRTERMLISATHTHSAPSVHGCLGSDKDEAYSAFLPAQIAKGIAQAHENLQPARIGWAVGKDPNNVFIRRFRMKPGTANTARFTGQENDIAQMNPGYANPNAVERIGVPDDDVSVVSIQTRDGRTLALLGNYSTHYAGYGATPVSADYFGIYCSVIAETIGGKSDKGPAFMAMLTNGTSGDTNCHDFTRTSAREFDCTSVAKDVAAATMEAYKSIEYFDWVPLVMEEKLLTLGVRMPSEAEVAEAKKYLAQFEGRKPQLLDEVYAREAVLLSQMPHTRELKLQAIRLGDLGITAIPNEVYSITGLTIKKESPLKTTFTIELANGCEGYIPPPDQHKLGGYTTWRARTSCLEVDAEPKIRECVMGLLKKVSTSRRDENPVPSKK